MCFLEIQFWNLMVKDCICSHSDKLRVLVQNNLLLYIASTTYSCFVQ
jgi:hypothetical protein